MQVTKPPSKPRPISCIQLRLNILVQCLLSTYIADQNADMVITEKSLQRRSDVINLIVAVIAATPLDDIKQLGDVFDPLVEHEDLRQQLKTAYHCHIIRRTDNYNAIHTSLIGSMYHSQEEEEAHRLSLQTNALLLNNATMEAVLAGHVAAVADIKRLLVSIDPTMALGGAKPGKAKKVKNSSDAPIHTLLLQASALQLWTALTQWALRYDSRRDSDREVDREGGAPSELTAEDIPQTAGRYLAAAMRHLKGMAAVVEGTKGSKSQAECWCVCDALLQCSRALMTSLYLAGRRRDQVQY